MLDYSKLQQQLDNMLGNPGGDPTANAMSGNTMDPIGSLREFSNYATRFQSNPGSGPFMMSDEDKKFLKTLLLPDEHDWMSNGS